MRVSRAQQSLWHVHHAHEKVDLASVIFHASVAVRRAYIREFQVGMTVQGT